MTSLEDKAVVERGPSRMAKTLVDLPADMVVEITSRVEPGDLLKLARVSKDFRAFFLSPENSYIWKSSFKNVDFGLPPCPDDMDLPEYASLLFDEHCMACGTESGERSTDFNVRVRFCSICFAEKIISFDERTRLGYAGLCVMIPMCESAWKIEVPRLGRNAGIGGRAWGWLNTNYAYYLKSDVIEICKSIDARRDDIENNTARYTTWFMAQFRATQQRKSEGGAMRDWHNELVAAEDERIENLRFVWQEQALKNLSLLGWKTHYFPGVYRNFDNPPELTPEEASDVKEFGIIIYSQYIEFSQEVWDRFLPQLESIYNRSKSRLQRGDLECRIAATYERQRLAEMSNSGLADIPEWEALDQLSDVHDFIDLNFQREEYKLEDGSDLIKLSSMTRGFEEGNSPFIDPNFQREEFGEGDSDSALQEDVTKLVETLFENSRYQDRQ